MKKLFILILLLGSSLSFGQNQSDIRRTYHWYFGNKAGLDFSDNMVVKDVTSQMNAYEGCASISDTCGSLLYYSNGDTIWNSNNNIILNGTGLMGCWSSTQSVIFIPQPNNDSLIYVFTTDCSEFNGINGLRYSIINSEGDNGNGEVIVKNQLMYQPCSEKLAVTRHANGTDYWIVSHEYNSSQFYSYLLTSTGISPPVTSVEGLQMSQYGDGQLAISPDGSKMATWYNLVNGYFVDTLELYDFDNTNGFVSNTISLPLDTADQAYGISFSPNGNILYVPTINTNGDLLTQLWQYDITSNNQAIIQSSRAEIFNSMNQWFYSMQIGADGRIYIAKTGTQFADSLAVINYPNSLGIACGFTLNEFDFSAQNIWFGLPNFPNSYFNNTTWLPNCSAGIDNISKDNKFNVYPNPATQFLVIESEINFSSLSFEITNLQGFKTPIKILNQNQNAMVLDVSSLRNGMYFLTINDQSGFHSYKFLKR